MCLTNEHKSGNASSEHPLGTKTIEHIPCPTNERLPRWRKKQNEFLCLFEKHLVCVMINIYFELILVGFGRTKSQETISRKENTERIFLWLHNCWVIYNISLLLVSFVSSSLGAVFSFKAHWKLSTSKGVIITHSQNVNSRYLKR